MEFKNYINENNILQETVDKYLAFTILMSEDFGKEGIDSMNESSIEMIAESITDKVSKGLDKAGLKLHKGDGIISYVMKFLKGTGKLFYHLFKGDVKKAKEVLRGLSKEEVLDFIYKLDLGTLHLFTGTLHTIDAWTGWDLTANVKSHMAKAQSLAKTFKDAIIKVKDTIVSGFSGKLQKNLLNHANELEKNAGSLST